MTIRQRLVLAACSLVLVAMYLSPLWHITLQAPQYPEGLGLKIMLSDVQGQHEYDLQNINNLNHYIGMKRIEPDAIPELRIMPWIVAGLIGLGLTAAASGKHWMLYLWCGVFLAVAVAGLVDFWLWAYDYGHNLDVEHAAIKVPGMSYQPPIIGSKQLLNFRAHSWPALGGWAAFGSLGVGMLLAVSVMKSRTRGLKVRAAALAGGPLGSLWTMGFVLVLAAGCRQGPAPFALGEDRDDYCRMTISDARFAAQVVTGTGKVYKFDSVECLRGFLHSGAVPGDEISRVWVTDAAHPGLLVPAAEAFFVRSKSIRSPMGGGLMAFSAQADADALAREVDGDVMVWEALTTASMATRGRQRP